MTSPFKLIDLPGGRWAVTWHNTPWALNGLDAMIIIFEEMKEFEATLGVLLQSGELDTLRIGLNEYYQKSSHVQDYIWQYIFGGAIFDTEAQAREFLQIAEKYHIMNLLKEPA